MDEVEAAEEILRGRPLILCWNCDELGSVIGTEKAYPRVTCDKCMGTRLVHRRAWVEAHQVLGLPLRTVFQLRRDLPVDTIPKDG